MDPSHNYAGDLYRRETFGKKEVRVPLRGARGGRQSGHCASKQAHSKYKS